MAGKYSLVLANRNVINNINHSFSGPLLTKPIDPIILLSLQACSKVQFPNIYTILHIMAVWPLTSCEAERSFTELPDIDDERGSFKWLALMMVHRTISVSVKNIIDTFAARHPRRMRLELIQRYAIDHCYECCVDNTCACGFVFITMRILVP